jgi:hypothetical protein
MSWQSVSGHSTWLWFLSWAQESLAIGLAANVIYFGRTYPAWLFWWLWISNDPLFRRRGDCLLDSIPVSPSTRNVAR